MITTQQAMIIATRSRHPADASSNWDRESRLPDAGPS
jgi:hypothetical protein